MSKAGYFRSLVMLIVASLLLAACGEAPPQPGEATATSPQQAQSTATPPVAGAAAPEAVVFAASSLQDAFGVISGDIAKAPPGKSIAKVTYNFGGSQLLATQLGQGARADVFASADAKTMNTAISSGVVEMGTQQSLVTNKLVVIVSKAAASRVIGLGDLVKPGAKIVLADQSVPAGNYSLQALQKLSSDKAGYGASYQRQVLANVVSKETNVRQVVAKVQLGEADAGIVYTTDAQAALRTSPQALSTIDIPNEFNVLAEYYIAPLKNAPHPEAARRFIAYVLSPEGQQVLGSYGFGPPSGAGE